MSEGRPPVGGTSLLGHGEIKRLVEGALAEDIGRRDLTTEIVLPGGVWARGTVAAQGKFVVAGLGLAELVFGALDGAVRTSLQAEDGARVDEGQGLVEVSGSAAALLAGERTLLNFLQHLSGIATMARAFVDEVAGSGVTITDTRKTTPGLRLLEKYASKVGGAANHRYGLDDGILIKNNHIALAGDLARAVKAARERAPWGMRVEVECSTKEEVEAALAAGVEAVLLDNLTPAAAGELIRLVAGRAQVEISGGVTLANVREYAAAGPDRISVGAITHSAPAVPIHMKIEPADGPGRQG